MNYLPITTMGIASPRTAGLLDTKSMSHTETHLNDDSISLPEGNITPPEDEHKGMNATAKYTMPHSLYLPEISLPSPTELLGHGSLVLSRWDNFLDVLTGRRTSLVIDGHSLDVAAIVAVAR